MNYDRVAEKREFLRLIINADSQSKCAHEALRAGRPRVARKLVLSAAIWLVEAELHQHTEGHRVTIKSSFNQISDVFSRLRMTDRFTLIAKVFLLKAFGKLFGAKRAMCFIRAWQEVRNGR
jgi:hypothetical protein